MKLLIAKDYNQLSQWAAEMIADAVKEKPDIVLGLATGGTPLGTYQALIEMHQREGIDFSKVRSFNLDEYHGLEASHPQSYHYFMQTNLFQHINIKPENVHIPNGVCENIEEECRAYDQKIHDCGGIDLQLLGIGANGHIGFNEPGHELQLNTHRVKLTEATIQANSRFFDSVEEVPTHAITMGIKGIMSAKKILLLASGAQKAPVIKRMLEGTLSTQVPASVLQLHPDVVIIVDQEIGDLLGDAANLATE